VVFCDQIVMICVALIGALIILGLILFCVCCRRKMKEQIKETELMEKPKYAAVPQNIIPETGEECMGEETQHDSVGEATVEGGQTYEDGEENSISVDRNSTSLFSLKTCIIRDPLIEPAT